MILFLADVPLFRPVSGAEQVLYHQAQGFARNGSEVCAITRVNKKSSIVVKCKKGMKELSYFADTKNVLRFTIQSFKKTKNIFDKLNRDIDFDVVICHQPFTLFPLLVTRKLKKLPVLYTYISPSHQEYLLINENQFGPLKIVHSLFRRIVERICLKKADKILFLSDYMKQKAIRIHHVQHKRLILNPAGVDLERFEPLVNRDEIKNRLFRARDKVHLLTVRNLERRMGLDNLLRSMHLLRKIGVQVFLVLGGEGPERNNLQKLIKKHGLSNDVKMTGFIPDEELPQYYNSADFFILPTRKLEGFGLVTLESMACGTPVLGTPVGATQELLSKFNNEFLFDSNSPEAMANGIRFAIDAYYKDKDKYRQIRLKCREHVQENYSWQRHVDQLKLIIDDLKES